MYLDKKLKEAIIDAKNKLNDVPEVFNPMDMKGIVEAHQQFIEIRSNITNLLNNICLDDAEEHKGEILEEYYN